MLNRLAILALLLAGLPIYGSTEGPKPSTDQKKTQTIKQKFPDSLPASIVNSVSQQAPSKQGDGAEDHPKGYFYRLFSPENLPNICLFVAGVVGIFVALRTLKVLSRQARSMRRQTRPIRKSAEAALLSAKAIMGSERAWILVKPELPNGLRAAPQNQITWFRWSIKNVGRTPARILETDALAARIEKMKDFPPKPRYVGNPLSMNEFLLVPNDSIPITWMIEGDSLTEDEVAKIREGLSLHFAAYGYVKYLDVFDKLHTMRFCHRFVVYTDTARSLMPIISAACHQVIFFASARKITSCIFIARSIAAFE
jgi:hypothetical protein